MSSPTGVPHITLLWYGGNGLVDRAIQAFTHSAYSHSAFIIGGKLYEEQAPGLIFWAAGGATKRANEAAAYKVVPLTDPQQTAIKTFVHDLIEEHAKYNYMELLGQALADMTGIPIVIAGNNDFVCSAICSQCLIYAGQTPMVHGRVRDARLMSPGDLATWQAPIVRGAPPSL